jgi:hypothetical protein
MAGSVGIKGTASRGEIIEVTHKERQERSGGCMCKWNPPSIVPEEPTVATNGRLKDSKGSMRTKLATASVILIMQEAQSIFSHTHH